MSLSDEKKKALAEELDRLHGKLQVIKRDLENANSGFAETQVFLNARGLTNVSQLDRQGLEDLRRHLESVLAKLSN
ncbi:MAG: hypothetical protein WCT10_00675 [Patescibacteria group bacterium]|jgi:hypothetical protein